MAKITEDQKKLLIADFLTGRFSQRALAKNYDVSIGTVSKLTKELNTENEHLVNVQKTLLIAKAELPNEQMNAIMNTAHDELRRENAILNATDLLLKAKVDLITKGTYKKPIKLKNGDCDVVEHFDHDLTPTDMNQLANGLDKLSITSRVNERFNSVANVNIANQNQQNTNVDIVGYGVKTINAD